MNEQLESLLKQMTPDQIAEALRLAVAMGVVIPDTRSAAPKRANYGRASNVFLKEKSRSEMTLEVHRRFKIGAHIGYPASSRYLAHSPGSGYHFTTGVVMEHRSGGLGIRHDDGSKPHHAFAECLMHLCSLYAYHNVVLLED